VSRYLILFILTAPFVLAALLNALVDYKMHKISRKKFWGQTVLWIFILVGIASAEPIYNFLFSNNLTQTEPLSLFDVIQISAIVMLLFVCNRARTKIDRIERRLQDLHQELSIQLSQHDKH
jgi:hypothetical protein